MMRSITDKRIVGRSESPKIRAITFMALRILYGLIVMYEGMSLVAFIKIHVMHLDISRIETEE